MDFYVKLFGADCNEAELNFLTGSKLLFSELS